MFDGNYGRLSSLLAALSMRGISVDHISLFLFFPQNVISAVRREEEETTEATEAEKGAPKALG